MTFASAWPLGDQRVGLLLRRLEPQLGDRQLLVRLRDRDVALLLGLLHDRDDLLVRLADLLVLRGHLLLRRQVRLRLGDLDLLLEREDLLLGDLALVDRVLDLVRRHDVAHQRLAGSRSPASRTPRESLASNSCWNFSFVSPLMKSRALYWLPTSRQKLRA